MVSLSTMHRKETAQKPALKTLMPVEPLSPGAPGLRAGTVTSSPSLLLSDTGLDTWQSHTSVPDPLELHSTSATTPLVWGCTGPPLCWCPALGTAPSSSLLKDLQKQEVAQVHHSLASVSSPLCPLPARLCLLQEHQRPLPTAGQAVRPH